MDGQQIRFDFITQQLAVGQGAGGDHAHDLAGADHPVAAHLVVRVERRFTHPVMKKTVRLSNKYHAHDEKNEFQVGDIVRIVGEYVTRTLAEARGRPAYVIEARTSSMEPPAAS